MIRAWEGKGAREGEIEGGSEQGEKRVNGMRGRKVKGKRISGRWGKGDKEGVDKVKEKRKADWDARAYTFSPRNARGGRREA